MALRGAFVLGLAASVMATHPVVELDMYRSLASSGLPYPTENNNLADITGAMKYVATEVIVESQLGNLSRTGRKYDIDVIVKSRYWVLNPPSVLSSTGGKVILTDFGPFMAFDDGVATNLPNQDDLANLGDFVGIQTQKDARFPVDVPYYWSSVSGFCPNLPWSEKWVDNGNGMRAPNSTCLRYTGGEFVRGGLCGMDPAQYTRQATAMCGKTGANDACDAEANMPTGGNGCTYMYGKSETVSLDDLAGLTSEDCGGRSCTGWYDFRLHCSNPAYKYRFDPASKQKVATDRCVEYDLHPACGSALGCEHPRCKALSSEEKELGVAFWKGRCDQQANQKRVEALAAAFQIPDAGTKHKIVDPQVANNFATCLHDKPGPCYPAPPGGGGQYCTRAFSGVCTPCKIPGAATEGNEQTWCPYDILSSPDYSDFNLIPKVECATNKAQDLCCLYRGTCEHQTAIMTDMPLDDDGFALVASKKDTSAMLQFLSRVADERMQSYVTSPDGLEQFAYWQWASTPTSRNISTAMAGLSTYVTARSTTAATTMTTTVASTSTTTTTEGAGAFPWWLAILAILLLLCCIGGVIAFLALKPGGSKKTKKTRKAPIKWLQEQESMNQPGSMNLPAAPATSPRSAPLLIGPVPVMPAMPAPTSPLHNRPSPRAAPMHPGMLRVTPTVPHAPQQLGSAGVPRQPTSPQPFQPNGAHPAAYSGGSGNYGQIRPSSSGIPPQTGGYGYYSPAAYGNSR